MKSLRIVQGLAKAGKILSRIIYICCIVGICGCLGGIISLIVGDMICNNNGYDLNNLIETYTQINLATIYTYIAIGIILCIGELIVSKYAEKYFIKELEDGTPFTIEGSKGLFNLGMASIICTISSGVISSIVQGILSSFLSNVQDLSFDSSIGLGIAFIVVSFILKCGAELISENKVND